jgi:hypothetical protein
LCTENPSWQVDAVVSEFLVRPQTPVRGLA